jgi:hypothetical protein
MRSCRRDEFGGEGGSVAAREKQVEGVGKSSADSLKITRCLSSPTRVLPI